MHSGVCGVTTLPRKKLDQGWYNEPVFSEYYIYGRALGDVELPIEIGRKGSFPQALRLLILGTLPRN